MLAGLEEPPGDRPQDTEGCQDHPPGPGLGLGGSVPRVGNAGAQGGRCGDMAHKERGRLCWSLPGSLPQAQGLVRVCEGVSVVCREGSLSLFSPY